MAISLQADSTQPRGYISIDGVQGVTVTQTGLSASSITTSSGSVDVRIRSLSSVSTALSGRSLSRSFENSGDGPQGRFIFIDSTLGNDSTADGTSSRPFQTILAAAEFWASNCETRGQGVVFKLVGTAAAPRTYKGCHLYFNPGRVSVSGATAKDPGVLASLGTGDPATYMSRDRTIFFQGNVEEPQGVIIEPIFWRARGRPDTGQDRNFYNGNCLRIEAPGLAIIVEGITFRYNPVGRLPNYTGNDPLYNATMDYYAHVDFLNCQLASVGRCIMNGCYDSTSEPNPGYAKTTTQASKYMHGIGWYNCQYPRVRSLTVTGSLRYICKVSGGIGNDGLRFDNPGTITLQNNPRFLALFEVEYGAGFIVDWISNPNVQFFPYTSTTYPDFASGYSLTFINPTTTGACGTVRAGTEWQNRTFTNFNSFFASADPWIHFPSENSNPAFTWPTNTQRVQMVHQSNPGTTFYRYYAIADIPPNNTTRNV